MPAIYESTHAESEYQLRSEDEEIVDAAGDANTDRRFNGMTGAYLEKSRPAEPCYWAQ